jgi:hypothetical protein
MGLRLNPISSSPVRAWYCCSDSMIIDWSGA